MIEKSDRNLFVQMLIFVASIFVVDILDNFASMFIIIVVSAVFFIQHLKNKIEINNCFTKRERVMALSAEVAKQQVMKDEKVHIKTEEDEYGDPAVFNAMIEQKQKEELRRKNEQKYMIMKEYDKKIGMNSSRKNFIFYLNKEKWTLWFMILGAVTCLRTLALLNIVSFSSLMATFLVVVSCLYIFRFELYGSMANIASNMIEYDFARVLYRAKILFGGLLLIFFLNGLICKPGGISLMFSLVLYGLIFGMVLYLIKILYTEDNMTGKDCAMIYLIKYQDNGSWNKDIILDIIIEYACDIVDIYKNISLNFKASRY